jgi:hypothetical protein
MHLFSLKYLLAGELQAIEPLDELEQLLRTIDWNDPEFLRMTDEMRVGVPKLTAEQEASISFSLLSILHAQKETIASAMETISHDISSAEQANERLRKLAQFASSLLDLHGKMRSHLDLLGADTSAYTLPQPSLR